MVEELDGRYKNRIYIYFFQKINKYNNNSESTIRDEFETTIQEAYKEKQEVQFDKMSKLIADMDSDNHRLRKEFELYKEVLIIIFTFFIFIFFYYYINIYLL